MLTPSTRACGSSAKSIIVLAKHSDKESSSRHAPAATVGPRLQSQSVRSKRRTSLTKRRQFKGLRPTKIATPRTVSRTLSRNRRWCTWSTAAVELRVRWQRRAPSIVAGERAAEEAISMESVRRGVPCSPSRGPGRSSTGSCLGSLMKPRRYGLGVCPNFPATRACNVRVTPRLLWWGDVIGKQKSLDLLLKCRFQVPHRMMTLAPNRRRGAA